MNQRTSARQSSAGFTLVELMITLVIVAILSAVAIPTYTDYIIRGRIAVATAQLSATRVRFEQFYQDNRTYVGACAVPTLPANDDFTYACVPAATATTYTVTATGGPKMTGFTYSINELNARTTVAPGKWGTGTTAINCWVIRKGGLC